MRSMSVIWPGKSGYCGGVDMLSSRVVMITCQGEHCSLLWRVQEKESDHGRMMWRMGVNW